MTSPLNSLKKGKRTPLDLSNGFGKRQMPFRMPDYSTSERRLLNDIHGHIPARSSSESSNESPTITPRRNCLNPILPSSKDLFNSFSTNKNPGHLGLVPSSGKAGSKPSNIPSDIDLMSSMMQKIAKLEKLNLQYSREIIEKDKRIKVLEEKNLLMEKTMKSGENESPSHIAELEAKCLELKQQIYEMETFLADYGMIWVGEKSNPNSSKYLDDDDIGSSRTGTTNTVWQPDSSRAETDFVPDYDLIIENINDLNSLAGDGEAKVAHTANGAKLKITDPIRLILYKNGIMMFNGPFRSFDDATTQRCIKDIMDGYFPSELQPRYPDGVPINVIDKRFVTFEDPRFQEEFPGVGRLLGGEKQPSNLVNSGLKYPPSEVSSTFSPTYSNLGDRQSKNEVTSELPGPKLSAEQFVGKLPKSVIRNGKIIDIRGSIAEQLADGYSSSSSAELVDTLVVQEMQDRMAMPETERPPSARNVTTLRIKSEEGDRALLLKMKFTETIADLRRYIDKQRPYRKPGYKIFSTFPSRVYSDESMTLQDCGLVPNANLFLRYMKG